MRPALNDSLLKNDLQEIAAPAARSLYMQEDEKGKTILHEKLLNGDTRTREIYLNIFSEVIDEYIHEEFIAALARERESGLCLQIALKIPEIPETDIIKKALTEELESDDPHKRFAAISVAGRINTGWSLELLKNALKDEPDRALKKIIKNYLS